VDAALSLPAGRHSHGLRRPAALEAVRGSYDAATAAVDRRCGRVVGKRQIEELVKAAAEDTDAFYARRIPMPCTSEVLLVLSADGKGHRDAARRTTAGHPQGRRGQEPGPGRLPHPAGLGREAVPQADGHFSVFADDVGRVLFPLMPDSGWRLAAAKLAAVRTVIRPVTRSCAATWRQQPALGRSGAPVPPHRDTRLGRGAPRQPGRCPGPLATMLGWPAAERLDRRRHGGRCPTIADARIIEATFALQQALPAALSGDAEALADGLTRYTAD
jgi:hypothetical protein